VLKTISREICPFKRVDVSPKNADDWNKQIKSV
jgi:hypothetical protein